jgi:hypothetical protein
MHFLPDAVVMAGFVKEKFHGLVYKGSQLRPKPGKRILFHGQAELIDV